MGQEDAPRAAGLAGDADGPAVVDEEVRPEGPLVLRDDLGEVVLDLDGVGGVLGEAEAVGEARDVRVDGDALVDSEGVSEDDVGGLSADAGEGVEGFHGLGDLAAVVGDEGLGHGDDGLGLVAVEAGGLDVPLELGLGDLGVGCDVGVLLEEGFGDDVDADVGALCGEDGGDEELERAGEVQRALCVGVGGLEEGEDGAHPCSADVERGLGELDHVWPDHFGGRLVDVELHGVGVVCGGDGGGEEDETEEESDGGHDQPEGALLVFVEGVLSGVGDLGLVGVVDVGLSVAREAWGDEESVDAEEDGGCGGECESEDGDLHVGGGGVGDPEVERACEEDDGCAEGLGLADGVEEVRDDGGGEECGVLVVEVDGEDVWEDGVLLADSAEDGCGCDGEEDGASEPEG